MKKILLLTTMLALIVAGQGRAQTTMSDQLAAMPDSVVPYLTKNNRLDLIDFRAAGMKAVVQNALDGRTELDVLTDRYARLQLTPATTAELRLLDVDEPVDSCRQVVAMLTTVGTDVRASVLRFYSCRWRQLDASQYVAWPHDTMCVARLSKADDQLVITPSDFAQRPASDDQKPMAQPSINLKWANNSFK